MSSRMRPRLLVAVTVLTVTAGLTAVTTATTGTASAAGQTTVQRFAPLVWLAKGDDYAPMSSHTFIANSDLRWAHDGGCSDHSLDSTPSESTMASGGYSHQTTGGLPFCSHGGTFYKSNQSVRPYGPGGPGSSEGMFLDLDNDLHPGGGTGAPVYVQHVGHALVYWFLYGWNNAPFKGWDHEGDWERVAVRRNAAGSPTAVVYWQHHSSCYVTWAQARKYNGHPVGFSAYGTHATYAKAGTYNLPGPDDDNANRGTAWKTWGNVDHVKAQAWWGYGGGWGEVGSTTDQTGPSGPNPIRSMSDVYTGTHC